MKILLVSNQIFTDGRVTNPVLQRMADSMARDKRVEDVMMMPVAYSYTGLKTIRNNAKNSDIIHIHFGGLYALAIWLLLIGVRKPKLVTFHGTDIHAKAIRTEKSILSKVKIKLNQYASFLSILAFDRIGFVASEMERYVPGWLTYKFGKKMFIQSLGVDYKLFQPMNIETARKVLGLEEKQYALFSTISHSNIKRQDIAEDIVKELGDEYRLLVMCGVKPTEVPVYINACNFLLLTSDEEGSPNIIRECLALNKPVFSVNVGDAAQQIEGLANSSIIERNPVRAATIIKEILKVSYTDCTRENLRSHLDFDCINRAIIDIYVNLLNN